MSTSFRDGFSGKSDSQAEGLSLRKFLSEGVFVGTEDILVTRCMRTAPKTASQAMYSSRTTRLPAINTTKSTRRFVEGR